LSRGRVLRGTIRDDAGKPVVGATVNLERQTIDGYHLAGNYWGGRGFRPNRPATTDSKGAFALTVHPAMRLGLRTTAKSYVPDVRDIDLLAFEGTLDICLTSGKRLSGRVLTEAGNPPGRDVHVSVFGLR